MHLDPPPGIAAALTHSSTLRRLLYEALAALGLDPTDTYRRAYQGLPLAPPLLDAREGHDNAPRFWQALEGISGDVDIGLHLGEVMKPRPQDVVGYLLLASRDLRQALEAFVRFQHILSGGFVARLEQQGDTARLIIDLNYRGVGSLRQQMECLALLLYKMLASVTDEGFCLSAIDFRHPAPRRLSEHRRLYGLLPQFSQAHDALIFPCALLNRPSRSANPRLFALLSGQAEQELAELAENQLLNRVRYWLGVNLGGQPCSLARCAQALNLKAGGLQRALAEQGSSFRALHDEVRRSRAVQLLENGQAIREVARACGFAELSPFYRAFRRWQGATPQAFRSAADGEALAHAAQTLGQ
ncbi:AraC family transcriptional regulator [Pseudomonas sp. UBA2684]|uniref:AraC family transcriptional regulator n=1 Tax=Pseudomonas sp. UBA2684 TaxID=1947311 RepID=UPI000E819ABC|nr:AraC family transcriptional regulator [Pseudomonas sp. UBA2684]HBX57538.1 AraC family transcriptional regulator [Pseudomonas sp.]|tara:strand:- start:541 stop:1611 length:1071 start_codon:yes stop_codon:yes gene_type:complete